MKTVTTVDNKNNNDSDGLKKAIIINDNSENDNISNNNNKSEINQRPNYMSNVIYKKPTSTLLKRNYNPSNNKDGVPTFDLNEISKIGLF